MALAAWDKKIRNLFILKESVVWDIFTARYVPVHNGIIES